MGSVLKIPVPRDFYFTHAVCSYGFYLLAPNRWDARLRVLHRPLRRADGSVVQAVIRSGKRCLNLNLSEKVATGDRALLKQAVIRTLRIDEDQEAWLKSYPEAKKKKFGRMYRSPTFFEDLIKTITSCNIAWSGTRRMNEKLCAEAGRSGDFPTAPELANWSAEDLARRCGVGYRAGAIASLARSFASGELNAGRWEAPDLPTDQIYREFLKLPGVGPYAASNLLQLLGRFDRIPIDTEARRHAREYHGRKNLPRTLDRWIEKHYRRYGKQAFKAFWFEHWTGHQ